jgi:MoxR-like ATPase
MEMKNTTIESGIKLYQDILSITPKANQYILDTPLRKAVETALRFNQPLLLTGEPGTGKTQLAYKVARLLHEQTKGEYLEEPLRFNTKTTSQARDLFYLYDAISHFQQANLRNLSDNSSLCALSRILSNFKHWAGLSHWQIQNRIIQKSLSTKSRKRLTVLLF